MTGKAIRMLIDRIQGKAEQPARNVVFTPSLVAGDSCMPIVKPAGQADLASACVATP